MIGNGFKSSRSFNSSGSYYCWCGSKSYKKEITRPHIKKSRTSRDCFDNPTGFLLKSKLMTYGNCSGIKIGKGNNLMKWERKVIFTSDFKYDIIIKK